MSDGGLVVYRAAGGVDAIDQYSRLLVSALRGAGTEASYVAGGPAAARERAAGAVWMLLQYNPFRYGRAGFAPRLVADVVALRRVPLALMVHEAWIDMVSLRSALIGAYQRAQLRVLL